MSNPLSPNVLTEETLATEYLKVTRENFRDLKKMGDKTLAQLSDEHMHWSPDHESNSIAVIIQHLHGNMRSRWTEFFTTDLEKPDRDRDSEFELRQQSKAELLELWEKGWGYVFATMDALKAGQLLDQVVIRGMPHTVVNAANRQVSHYAYHVGQIVYIAKHLRSAEWQTLSIARGKSRDYVPDPLTGK